MGLAADRAAARARARVFAEEGPPADPPALVAERLRARKLLDDLVAVNARSNEVGAGYRGEDPSDAYKRHRENRHGHGDGPGSPIHSAGLALGEDRSRSLPKLWADLYERRAIAMGGERLGDVEHGPFPVEIHARALAEIRAEARRVINREKETDTCHWCRKPVRWVVTDVRDPMKCVCCVEPERRRGRLADPGEAGAVVAVLETGERRSVVAVEVGFAGEVVAGWVPHTCAEKPGGWT